MNENAAILIDQVSHHYGRRQALAGVSLEIQRGEIFAFLGPNGGGKTTLFRLLSTLLPVQAGAITILGRPLASRTAEVRARIGVVFQAPALDRKLTVAENMRQQAALYGLYGAGARQRETEMMDQFALRDRANELVESLSGGLRRRLELAKGMLHRPQLLLLDEPSTGLDPGARGDLWEYLRRARAEQGVTVALTTHLLEEAEHADRLAILHEGRLVALDTPDALRRSVGGDSITIETKQPVEVAAEVRQRFSLSASVVDAAVRLESPDAHLLISRLVEALPGKIDAIRLGKPTLEDVFIARTGRRFLRDRPEGRDA